MIDIFVKLKRGVKNAVNVVLLKRVKQKSKGIRKYHRERLNSMPEKYRTTNEKYIRSVNYMESKDVWLSLDKKD